MTLIATRRRMFINGDWSDAADGETTSVVNPATEETIDEVPKGTEADIDRAVAAAREAFGEWSQTTPGERSAMLWKWAAKIEEAAPELSKLESANVGKPKGVADFDVEFSVDNLRFFAGAARVVEGKAAGEYSRAGRRWSAASRWGNRPGRAVELPADDGDLEARPGARGGQHRRAQAVRPPLRSRRWRWPNWRPTSSPRACSTS